ncbi:glycoside hydrolase family 2 TIM barrel-domain containing protein [Puia sp. P3]|uniref:glycoside hydrolase family 2 TIM barrel-domain containing protein n=1 Tax=Puia sp. P3 TaxID=3423952 RepID=UPI003D67DCA4
MLDELTGWHHAYDTEVGSGLVKEMIEKDVNHPSIVVWDNGNEGGFNFDLDPLFDRYDIQGRPLIHPWAVFRHTDTQHYINYDYGNETYWHGHDIVFPTEFLHGLYDGGHGAGLSDFWELMWHEPLSAGGFLWDFSDEAVVRRDWHDSLDTDRDHGPDGILGPHREKEGSYYAVKEVWSPVKIERREVTAAFDGRFAVENRYFYTNLKECRFSWRLVKTLGVSAAAEPGTAGAVDAPDVAPGAKGTIVLSLPANWRTYDVLGLVATDKFGREIYSWTWPIVRPDVVAARMVDTVGIGTASVGGEDSSYCIVGGWREGLVWETVGFASEGGKWEGEDSFSDGPTLAMGSGVFVALQQRMEGRNAVIEVSYAKQSITEKLRWTMYPSGWLKMEIHYFRRNMTMICWVLISPIRKAVSGGSGGWAMVRTGCGRTGSRG